MNRERSISSSQDVAQRHRMTVPTREGRRSPLTWWYRISTPHENDTGIESEIISRARLASILLLIALIAAIAFIPAALTSDNLHVLPPVIVMLVIIGISIPLNRYGHVALVGILLVCTLDLALIFTLLTYSNQVLPQNAVPIYDLFVLPDIIAVSLLPASSILYISFFHSVFMCADIVLQPHTPDLQQLLHETGYSIMIRPLTIQIVVALVIFLWVRSTARALERANKAELIAELEHTIAQQKQDLDEGIQQVLSTLVQAANGNLKVRAPLAREHVLWQVGVALNTLLSRLQRANQSEQELQKIQMELQRVLYSIREAKEKQTACRLMPGGTELDPLISELLSCYLIQSPTASDQRRFPHL